MSPALRKPTSPEPHELFRKADYIKAENIFHRLAENKKLKWEICMEARYFEAESLRLQGCYPDAADTYVRVLQDFNRNMVYREQCCQHMYDIANYWLDETREEMRETKEQREGKRMVVWPHFVSFEKSKPLVDREGRAVQKLEQVRLYDQGPLADKALFLAGSVMFFNENYKEADYYFSQIYERSKNSPLAEQAVELAIISKHMSTGGSDYDGRKAAEARKLIDAAATLYPELRKKEKFLTKQVERIHDQQADKDMKMAQFFERTNHPGAAYFYYSMVTKRYRGSDYARKAEQKLVELREKVEKEERERAKEEAALPKITKPSGLSFLPANQNKAPTVGPAQPGGGLAGTGAPPPRLSITNPCRGRSGSDERVSHSGASPQVRSGAPGCRPGPRPARLRCLRQLHRAGLQLRARFR